MFETVLHTGAGHPDLTWIVVASVVSFGAGAGAGIYVDRLRERVGLSETGTAE